MPESEVILGYAEEVTAKNKKRILQDVTISRIGGSPSWLKGKIPKDDILLCPKCSKSMKLLLQMFAAEQEDKPHAYVRLLYIFTCEDGQCADPGFSKSFKVLRSQSREITLAPTIEPKDKPWRLFEVESETEPEEVAKLDKKLDKVNIEANDGSEKYTKVKGDSAFYKFQKRIGMSPEQVIRYVRGQELLSSSEEAALWISDKGKLADNKITSCPECKAARSLELQIMPTMLSCLDLDDTKVESLDWGVLNIYTCNNSCDAANEKLVEELLWRQEYDMKQSIF